MRNLPFLSVPFISILLFNRATPGAGGACNIDVRFQDLFLQAIDKVEDRIQKDVKEKIDDLGLGPFALPFSDISDVKEDVFDALLGGRTTWFNGTYAVDVEAKLQEALSRAIGLKRGSVALGCNLTNTETLALQLSFQGLAAVSFNSTSIALLPDPLPELSVELIPPTIEYYLQIPFTISLNGDFVSLGETVVHVSATLEGSISQDLPILPTGQSSVGFTGSIKASASFAFSSSSPLVVQGSFDASASVDSLNNPDVVANLALRAHDDNFFDSVPPSVAFDFNLCDVRAYLVKAISELSVEGVIDQILDKNLDLQGNEILQSSIVENIKEAWVTEAQRKVDEVKTQIVSAINAIDCTRRHLRSGLPVELGVTGEVQRNLQATDTFSYVASQIKDLPFVSSFEAGYFAGRDEIAIDLIILVEEAFDMASFTDALLKVFENFQGQSLFAASDMSDINGLLASLHATTSFTADLSFGLKVGDLSSILSKSTSATAALGGLFLRVNDLSLNAKVVGVDLASPLFGSVNIKSGALELMVGVDLAEAYELELKLEDGSL